MGGGSKGKNIKDILSGATETPAGPQPLPTDPQELASNMMSRGRPAFDFSSMGSVLPLAGAVAQPKYTTPPPQFNKQFWMNWKSGQAVDGSKDWQGVAGSYDTPKAG